MRVLGLILSFALIGIVSSSSPYQNLTQLQAATPACARKCNSPSISGLTCKLTSVQELADCICTNSTVRRKISTCVQQNCSDVDIALASKISRSYCALYPVPSRSHEIRITTIVVLIITIPFLLGRAWMRIFIVRDLWWDDYTLALAVIVMIAYVAINIPMADLGLGKHVWDLDPAQSASLAKMYYFAQIAYTLVQNITKISLLLCFLRIFPQQWFRYTVFFSLAWVSSTCIIYSFLLAIRCNPIQASWNHAIHGKCLSLNKIAYSGAVFSIVGDIWILVLPIPLLSSLKVAKGRKLVLMAMFSIGTLACVTSMVRLKHISDFGLSLDPTWDNMNGSIWSVIENAVAIICTCLPALRPLLGKLLPRFFGSIHPSIKMRGEGDDYELQGTLGTNGRKRTLVANRLGEIDATNSNDIYGMRSVDLEETRRSVGSLNFEERKSEKGIRIDTVVRIGSEEGEMPVKGQVRGI